MQNSLFSSLIYSSLSYQDVAINDSLGNLSVKAILKTK